MKINNAVTQDAEISKGVVNAYIDIDNSGKVLVMEA
jgi:hypothetical protein